MTFRSSQILKFSGSISASAIVLPMLIGSTAVAGEADVVGAEIRRNPSGSFTISATVLHDDSGWDHYADAFEILSPDGTVLATRVLLHPHENEQPFTRSVSGIEIPEHVDAVTVRAHDKIHGHGGKTFELKVAR